VIWIATLSLAVATLAFAGCRKPPVGGLTSFPNPAAGAMKSGDFITTTGVFESTDNPGLPNHFLDYRVSLSQPGKTLEMKLHYEMNRLADPSAVNGSGDEQVNVEVFPGWFCFVERPGIYWIFDGKNYVRLDSHGPLGGPSKSIIQGTYVNRENPKVPDAVLARLPEKQRDLLSPPAGERPAF
jgi:hypothetical protein